MTYLVKNLVLYVTVLSVYQYSCLVYSFKHDKYLKEGVLKQKGY